MAKKFADWSDIDFESINRATETVTKTTEAINTFDRALMSLTHNITFASSDLKFTSVQNYTNISTMMTDMFNAMERIIIASRGLSNVDTNNLDLNRLSNALIMVKEGIHKIMVVGDQILAENSKVNASDGEKLNTLSRKLADYSTALRDMISSYIYASSPLSSINVNSEVVAGKLRDFKDGIKVLRKSVDSLLPDIQAIIATESGAIGAAPSKLVTLGIEMKNLIYAYNECISVIESQEIKNFTTASLNALQSGIGGIQDISRVIKNSELDTAGLKTMNLTRLIRTTTEFVTAMKELESMMPKTTKDSSKGIDTFVANFNKLVYGLQDINIDMLRGNRGFGSGQMGTLAAAYNESVGDAELVEKSIKELYKVITPIISLLRALTAEEEKLAQEGGKNTAVSKNVTELMKVATDNIKHVMTALNELELANIQYGNIRNLRGITTDLQLASEIFRELIPAYNSFSTVITGMSSRNRGAEDAADIARVYKGLMFTFRELGKDNEELASIVKSIEGTFAAVWRAISGEGINNAKETLDKLSKLVLSLVSFNIPVNASAEVHTKFQELAKAFNLGGIGTGLSEIISGIKNIPAEANAETPISVINRITSSIDSIGRAFDSLARAMDELSLSRDRIKNRTTAAADTEVVTSITEQLIRFFSAVNKLRDKIKDAQTVGKSGFKVETKTVSDVLVSQLTGIVDASKYLSTVSIAAFDAAAIIKAVDDIISIMKIVDVIVAQGGGQSSSSALENLARTASYLRTAAEALSGIGAVPTTALAAAEAIKGVCNAIVGLEKLSADQPSKKLFKDIQAAFSGMIAVFNQPGIEEAAARITGLMGAFASLSGISGLQGQIVPVFEAILKAAKNTSAGTVAAVQEIAIAANTPIGAAIKGGGNATDAINQLMAQRKAAAAAAAAATAAASATAVSAASAATTAVSGGGNIKATNKDLKTEEALLERILVVAKQGNINKLMAGWVTPGNINSALQKIRVSSENIIFGAIKIKESYTDAWKAITDGANGSITVMDKAIRVKNSLSENLFKTQQADIVGKPIATQVDLYSGNLEGLRKYEKELNKTIKDEEASINISKQLLDTNTALGRTFEYITSQDTMFAERMGKQIENSKLNIIYTYEMRDAVSGLIKEQQQQLTLAEQISKLMEKSSRTRANPYAGVEVGTATTQRRLVLGNTNISNETKLTDVSRITDNLVSIYSRRLAEAKNNVIELTSKTVELGNEITKLTSGGVAPDDSRIKTIRGILEEIIKETELTKNRVNEEEKSLNIYKGEQENIKLITSLTKETLAIENRRIEAANKLKDIIANPALVKTLTSQQISGVIKTAEQHTVATENLGTIRQKFMTIPEGELTQLPQYIALVALLNSTQKDSDKIQSSIAARRGANAKSLLDELSLRERELNILEKNTAQNRNADAVLARTIELHNMTGSSINELTAKYDILTSAENIGIVTASELAAEFKVVSNSVKNNINAIGLHERAISAQISKFRDYQKALKDTAEDREMIKFTNDVIKELEKAALVMADDQAALSRLDNQFSKGASNINTYSNSMSTLRVKSTSAFDAVKNLSESMSGEKYGGIGEEPAVMAERFATAQKDVASQIRIVNSLLTTTNNMLTNVNKPENTALVKGFAGELSGIQGTLSNRLQQLKEMKVTVDANAQSYALLAGNIESLARIMAKDILPLTTDKKTIWVGGGGGTGGIGGGGGGNIPGGTNPNVEKETARLMKLTEARIDAMEAAKANGLATLAEAEEMRLSGVSMQTNIDALNNSSREILKRKLALETMIQVLQREAQAGNISREVMEQLTMRMRESVNATGELGSMLKMQAASFKRFKDSARDAGEEIASTVAMQMRQFTSFTLLFGITSSVRETFNKIVEESKYLGIALSASRSDVDSLSERLEILHDTMDRMRVKFGSSSEEIGQALYQMGSAGLNMKDTLASIEPIMKLIVGTGAEANDIAKTMAATFNVLSYQGALTGNSLMDLAHIADVTAAIFRDNQMEIDEFTNALKYTLPIAHLVGVSFEELSAILGTLHNQGIKAGQAGRSLRSVFFSIAQNREKFERAFADLGIEIDPSGPLKFMDILDQLGDKLGRGAISVSRLEQVVGALNMRGTGPFLLLAQSAGLLKQNLSLAKDGADGAAGALAKMKTELLAGQIKIMNENLFVFSKTFIGWFVKGIEYLIQAFNKLAEVIRVANEAFGGLPGNLLSLIGLLTGIVGSIALIRQVFLGVIGLIIYLNRTINGFIATTSLATGAITMEDASLKRNTISKELNAVATANLTRANEALAVSSVASSATSGFGSISGFGGGAAVATGVGAAAGAAAPGIGAAAAKTGLLSGLLSTIGAQLASLKAGFLSFGSFLLANPVVAIMAVVTALVVLGVYLKSTSKLLLDLQDVIDEGNQLLQDMASATTENIRFQGVAGTVIDGYKRYNKILQDTGSSATELIKAHADLNNLLMQNATNPDVGSFISVDDQGNLSLAVNDLEAMLAAKKELARLDAVAAGNDFEKKRTDKLEEMGKLFAEAIKRARELENTNVFMKARAEDLKKGNITQEMYDYNASLFNYNPKEIEDLNKKIIDLVFSIRKLDNSSTKKISKEIESYAITVNDTVRKVILATKELSRELVSFGKINIYKDLAEQSDKYKFTGLDLSQSIADAEKLVSILSTGANGETVDLKTYIDNVNSYLEKHPFMATKIPLAPEFDSTAINIARNSMENLIKTISDMNMSKDFILTDQQAERLEGVLDRISAKYKKGIIPSKQEAYSLLTLTSQWAEEINSIRSELSLEPITAWILKMADGFRKGGDASVKSLTEGTLLTKQMASDAESFARAMKSVETPVFGALAPAIQQKAVAEDQLKQLILQYTKLTRVIGNIPDDVMMKKMAPKSFLERFRAQTDVMAGLTSAANELAGDMAAVNEATTKDPGSKLMTDMKFRALDLKATITDLNHQMDVTITTHRVNTAKTTQEYNKVAAVGDHIADQLEYKMGLEAEDKKLMADIARITDVAYLNGIAYLEERAKFSVEALKDLLAYKKAVQDLNMSYMESVGKLMEAAEGQRTIYSVMKDMMITYDKFYNLGKDINALETRRADLLEKLRRTGKLDKKEQEEIYSIKWSVMDMERQRIDYTTEYLNQLREMRGIIAEINNLYKEFLGIQKDAIQSMASVYEERLSRISDAFSKIIESMASNSPSSFAIKTAVAMGSLEGITMDTSDAIQEMVKELEEGSIQSGLMGMLFGNSIGGMSKKIFELTNTIKELGREETEITKKMAAFDINILNQILGRGIDKMTMEDLGRAKESLSSLLGYSKEFAKVDPDSALELYRSIASIAGEMAQLTLMQKDELILRMGLDPTDFYRTLDQMTKKMEDFIDMVSQKYGGLTIQAYGLEGSKIDIKKLVLTTLQGLLAELLDKRLPRGAIVQPAQNTGNTGFASGGMVPGGSSAQGDIIPAMLTPGEFVIPADVVSRVGVGNFMNLISGGHGVMRFAGGGPVGPIDSASYPGINFIELMKLMESTTSNLMRTVDKLSPIGINSSDDPRWNKTDTAHITSSQFEMAISKVIDLVTLQQQLITTYKSEQERISGNTESITSILKKLTFGSSTAYGEPIVAPVVEKTIDLSVQFNSFLSSFNNTLDDFIINLTGVLSRGISVIPATGFASGGSVPGSGNRDTIPAMLTPGEFVIPADVVSRIGADKLYKLIHGTGLTDADYQELLGIFYESRIGNRTLAKGLRRNKMSFYDYLNSQEDAGYDLYAKIRDFAQEKHVAGFNKGGLVGGVQYMAAGGIPDTIGEDKQYLASTIDLFIDNRGVMVSGKLMADQFIKTVEEGMEGITHMFDPIPPAIIEKLIPPRIQTALVISNQYKSNPEKLAEPSGKRYSIDLGQLDLPSSIRFIDTKKIEPELLQPLKADQEDISRAGDLLGERFARSVEKYLSTSDIIAASFKKAEPLVKETIPYSYFDASHLPDLDINMENKENKETVLKINSEQITKASNELNNMKDILGKLNLNAMSNFETQWRKLLNQSIIKPFFAVLTKMRVAWKDEWSSMLDTTLPLIARFMPMIGQALIEGIVGAISGLPEIFNSVLGEVMDMSWIPFDDKLVDDTAKTMQDIKDSYEDGLAALVKQLRRNEISYLDYLNGLEDLQDKYLDDVAKANEDAAATPTAGEDFFATRVDQIVQAIATGFSGVASSFAGTLQSAITEALKAGAENSLTDLKAIFLTAGAALFSMDFGTNKNGTQGSVSNNSEPSMFDNMISKLGDLFATSPVDYGPMLKEVSLSDKSQKLLDEIGVDILSSMDEGTSNINTSTSKFINNIITNDIASSSNDNKNKEQEKESTLFRDIAKTGGLVVSAFSDTIGVVLGLGAVVASFGGMLAGLTREGVGTFFAGKTGIGGASDLPSIYETIDGVVSRFVTEIPTVMTMIAANAGPLIAKLSEGLKVVIPIIMDAAKQFVQILIDNLPAIVEGLTSALSGIIEGVVAMMPQIAELLGGLMSGLLDIIINSIIGNLASIIDGLLMTVVSVIDAILSKLGDIIGSLIEQIPGIIVALVNATSGIITSIVRNIPKIIVSLISHLPKIIFEIIKAIPQIIWAVIKLLPQIAFEFVKALVSSLGDMLGDIPILGDVLGGLSDGIEWLGGAVSDVGDALSSIFGSDKVTKQQTYKDLLAKRSTDSNVSLDLTAMKEILQTQGIEALANRLISMASMGQLTVEQLDAVKQLLSEQELEAAGLAKLGLRVNTDQLSRLTEMVKYLEEISSNTTPEQQKIYYDQALAAAPAIRQEWLGTVDSSGNRGMIGAETVSNETLASMISTLQALNVSNDKIQEMVVSFSKSSAAMGLSAADSQKAWELLQTQASQTGLTGDALAAVMKLAISEQQAIAAIEATGQDVTEGPLDYFLKEYQKLLQEYLQPQYGLSAEEARSRAAAESSVASTLYWSDQIENAKTLVEMGRALAEVGNPEGVKKANELLAALNSVIDPMAMSSVELFAIYTNLKTLNAETAAAAAAAAASSPSASSDSGTSQDPNDWHTGGIVYAHRGFLAKDEVPAVLLTGEGVLNREAMKAIGEDNFRLLNAGVSLEQIMAAATKKYVDVSSGATTGLPPVIHNDSSSQDNSSNQSTEINNHSEDNRTVVQFSNCKFERGVSADEIEDHIVSNWKNRNGKLQAIMRNNLDNKTSRNS